MYAGVGAGWYTAGSGSLYTGVGGGWYTGSGSLYAGAGWSKWWWLGWCAAVMEWCTGACNVLGDPRM